MRADSHIHTKYSCDSKATFEEYILAAEQNNLEWICFTEHVDYNKIDDGYRYYSADRFFEAYRMIKSPVTISVKAGLEFSEPHLYMDQLKELSKYPYDFILGSVHWVGNLFPILEVRNRYSAKDFFTFYWEEVLKTSKAGGFDCLGHIDFPKRYYQELYYQESMIREIMKRLIDKDIILEINTSSLRKGYHESMPGIDFLEIYREEGGKFITIGSDAHIAVDLGADLEPAKQMIEKMKLQEVVFDQRKRIVI